MNSSHFSDKRICIKDVIVSAWGHKQVPTFTLTIFCPFYALWISIQPRFAFFWKLNFPQKAGLNVSTRSSYRGTLILCWLVLWVSQFLEAGVFCAFLSLVNSTAPGLHIYFYDPLWPIVHNSHRQRTRHTSHHEKTRQEEGERGGEHSVGRSTDSEGLTDTVRKHAGGDKMWRERGKS